MKKEKWVIASDCSTTVIPENRNIQIDVIHFKEDTKEAESIARKIAALPELLEFAIEMVKRYPNSPWIAEQGSNAIKKATQ